MIEDGKDTRDPKEVPEGTEVATTGEVPNQPEMGQEPPPVDPELQQKTEAYIEGLSKLLHSKETKEQVYGMLQSGDPMDTVPKTALAVNDQMESQFKKRGTEVDLDVLVSSASFLVSDLVEIGNAGDFFYIDPEDDRTIGTLLTATMQPWIEKKIDEDPEFAIELQNRVNPLIDEQKAKDLNEYGSTQGVPDEAGLSQAMQVTKQKGVLEGMEKGKKAQQGGIV